MSLLRFTLGHQKITKTCMQRPHQSSSDHQWVNLNHPGDDTTEIDEVCTPQGDIQCMLEAWVEDKHTGLVRHPTDCRHRFRYND
ncbi:hypothetical protein [Microbulbifer sp. GL-2]|uniref:hypothetical protein n=1 Tax=Microbulbifer sp. GL-2 TaxID=2591606 RepID=UPI00117D4F92|nr:hypothetical protein [Microbulbifer sp. GL-2]